MSSVIEQGKADAQVERYLAQFEQNRGRRAGVPAWLSELREGAIARFAALGFPTTRDE